MFTAGAVRAAPPHCRRDAMPRSATDQSISPTQVNVLYGLLRQSLREKRNGFLPTAPIAQLDNGLLPDRGFTSDTFFLDPVRPRLIDLLTPREILRLRHFPASTRVMVVAAELSSNVQRLAPHLVYEREFVRSTSGNMQQLLDSYKACQRIVDTPLPFPYAHMLALILFVFVFISPFIYTIQTGNPASGVVPSVLLVLAYYGIEEIAIEIENPFNWDDVDHDFETFGAAIHDETLAIATADAAAAAKRLKMRVRGAPGGAAAMLNKDYWPVPRTC